MVKSDYGKKEVCYKRKDRKNTTFVVDLMNYLNKNANLVEMIIPVIEPGIYLKNVFHYQHSTVIVDILQKGNINLKVVSTKDSINKIFGELEKVILGDKK